MKQTGPALSTGIAVIDRAFRLAHKTLRENIRPFQDGLLASPKPCVLAGGDYDTPWTRDAAFNTWYAAGLLYPDAAKNTLLAVLIKEKGRVRIGGQYWDAIVWTTGAWQQYLYTGDKNFLMRAFGATQQSLAYFEGAEFDPADGLFRGGACFQDGVAGYPDQFAQPLAFSGIEDWTGHHPDKKVATGYGLPLKALSTNCLYYNAYRLLGAMARELGAAIRPEWDKKARALRKAINDRFWNPDTGTYRYLIDANDTRDRQEGFGHAFAILFGVAGQNQIQSIFKRQTITPHGIACVWPAYERYTRLGADVFGRHSGTIWPQVNTAWAVAAAQNNRPDLALAELYSLAEKACRDRQFTEIYHPLSGKKYGGMQEHPEKKKIILWKSCKNQTWCATGYIQMVLSVLFGLRFSTRGLVSHPILPRETDEMNLHGLYYRGRSVAITVTRGPGNKVLCSLG